MTSESEQIAAMIDGYPPHIRERLRDSMTRLVEVYRTMGVRQMGEVQRVRPDEQPVLASNVVAGPWGNSIKRSRRSSTRQPVPCGSLSD